MGLTNAHRRIRWKFGATLFGDSLVVLLPGFGLGVSTQIDVRAAQDYVALPTGFVVAKRGDTLSAIVLHGDDLHRSVTRSNTRSVP